MSCYELVKEFKKKYPTTVAWRLYQNARVIDEHINPGEVVTYAFAGQKNDSMLDIFQTAVIAITNKRILIGQKRVLFGYALNSITPDLYNDMQVYETIFWGKIVIDTIKEQLTISNLAKDSLLELETVISEFMMDEKKNYAQHPHEKH